MSRRKRLFGSAIQPQPDNTLSSVRRVLTRPDRVITMVLRCLAGSGDSDKPILWERRTPACMWSPGRDGASGETEPPWVRFFVAFSSRGKTAANESSTGFTFKGDRRGERVHRQVDASALVQAPDGVQAEQRSICRRVPNGTTWTRPGPIQSQLSSSRSLTYVWPQLADGMVSGPWRSGSSIHD